MKLKMNKGRAASQSEITALQQKIGMPLPSEFLEFVATNDGAVPETNIFKVGSDQESGVNGFIPIGGIAEEMERVEFLPETAIPVAWAEGGNYVFINKDENGAVYFWDHEQPDITKLADSFRLFLCSLEPFDVSTIKLKPGQVKKVWIDPDFLKSIQRGDDD